MRRIFCFLAVILIGASGVIAQKSNLKGHVKDQSSGDPVPFASVVVMDGEEQLGGTATDYEGRFVIKLLPAREVSVKVMAVGYQTILHKKLVLKESKETILDFKLVPKQTMQKEVQIVTYKVPIIDRDTIQAGPPMMAEDIEKMPGNRSLIRSSTGQHRFFGKVLDQSTGNPIPFAAVVLSDNDLTIAGVTSDAQGRFAITKLLVGKYDIEVSAPGYKKKEIKKYPMAGEQSQLNLQLTKNN